MEFFQGAKSVRLKSHHNKYLYAGDDEMTVNQDRDGTDRNVKWQVEFVEGQSRIRLKSSYNCYLTATEMPFLLGWTGKKVLQTVPSRLDSSVEWEPVKDGNSHVLLKTQYGTYLRSNGFTKPWKNKVTHDIPHRTITQYWVFWEVQITEIDMDAKLAISPPSTPRTPNGRSIYYAIGDENGNIKNEYEWPYFIFRGNDFNKLSIMLEEQSGLHDIIICVRHPHTKKLIRLGLQLPPNNAPMHLVLLPSSSNGTRSLA
ncbi:hypothetical protein SUGI_0628200 [Cryptomeria japonica]|uniref:uncharacterized protein LOC131038966 n=1 Tax=Cryptomeria japonica TaxID=3369 RepID=UPI0024149EE4|nr:uncharacterized protein LOC131038966 [Cryptomeria japonica]GLJ31311.1 hypothetical protein SUGI_0628200 [Cryptomeria japonica]